MAVIGNNSEPNGAVSQDLSKIQTVETATKLSETKITAQNLKKDIDNTANTKVETDGQTWRRLKRIVMWFIKPF